MPPIFDSRDINYKKPFGAAATGQEICFTLRVPADYFCSTPYLFLQKEGGETKQILLHKTATENGRDIFTVCHKLEYAGLYFYWFDLWTGYRKLFKGEDGKSLETTESGRPYQLTVYNNAFYTPKSMWGGVMYQIFPDRFYDGKAIKQTHYNERIYRTDIYAEPYFWPNNIQDGFLTKDYFGGDLAGIEQKLPYLASLGVSIIYLNPIFEAHSNHRYNTADYMNIDPDLGTNDDFISLCKAAKERGMRIILDGVFSHTGSDSIYFNKEGRYNSFGAFQGEDSPYRKWYDFGANGEYKSWWGFDTLPECNKGNENFREFICGENGVIDTWIKRGASGFRLDVADELTDDFIEDIRAATKKHGEENLLIGEVWEDATTKHGYGARRKYFLGSGLDGVMNYPFMDAILKFAKTLVAEDFENDVMEICENYPSPALNVCTTHLATHDTVRAITAIADEEVAGHQRDWQSGRRLSPQMYEFGVSRLLLAFVLQFSLPGIPCVYYGDEIAMQGYKDPFNRAFFQWNSGENRIKNTMTKLSDLRQNHSSFADGSLAFHKAEDKVLVLERKNSKESVLVAVNGGSASVKVTLHGTEQEILPMQWGYSVQKLD